MALVLDDAGVTILQASLQDPANSRRLARAWQGSPGSRRSPTTAVKRSATLMQDALAG
jgi:hypothetical protein